MKLIAIGDNVVDCYIDDQLYYPGGNAVNVAVNCKRYGSEKVNYIGVLGNDDKAEHILACLEREGVTTKRSRRVFAPTAQPRVVLQDGDRVFLPGLRDSCQHLFRIKLVDEDFAIINEYDICHTSCYSNLEYELPVLQEKCDISFDFSDMRDEAYLERVCPYIKIAFFSGSDLADEEMKQLMQKCYALGTKIIGVTRGSKGAVFFDGKNYYHQGIKATAVVDTMGAGDSFIAGFLVKYGDGSTMAEALEYAAECGAKACTFHGGFGYPQKL